MRKKYLVVPLLLGLSLGMTACINKSNNGNAGPVPVPAGTGIVESTEGLPDESPIESPSSENDPVDYSGTGNPIDNSNPAEDLYDADVFAAAKSVFDLKDYMGFNEAKFVYSDLKDYDDLLFYFDVLKPNEYIKVNHDGKDYVLIDYSYYDYDGIIEKLNGVSVNSAGNTLTVTPDIDVKEVKNEGCFPWTSDCYFIIEVNKTSHNRVFVGKQPIEEYSGGHVKICGKEGLLDKDLNFLISPIYEGIYEETSDNPQIPDYYRVYLEGHGNGIYDNNFNMVLSPEYMNIHWIDLDKFIVMVDNDTDVEEEKSEIQMIDSKGNVLKKMYGFLKAPDDCRFYCHEGHLLFSKRSEGMWGEGVMDEDMNIIIEPEYYMIFWVDDCYKVEDMDHKEAQFDYDGNQMTEFR